MKDRYFGISPRIARWKIDTPLENWLSHKADNSEFWKKIYVGYYSIFDREYYEGGVRLAKEAIELHKEELKRYTVDDVVRDMVYCLHRFGISFQDYCIYGFIDKKYRCRASFVSDKLRYHYCDILNKENILSLMTDKYACYKKYHKFFKRDVLGCYNETDKGHFLSFADKHKHFIFKPLEEHSGHGIKIVSSKETDINMFFTEMIAKGAFVVEELINQGRETAIMHPQSVNSLRVVTFVLEGKVNIIGVTWRIGVGNAVMDNAGSGGIYASIDPEYGFVQTDAINYRGEHFNIHPDTNIQIVGYKLPKWDEALSLIHDMAVNVEGATLISWDIAYSDKGWLMIEANDNGDWSIIQSNKKIGKKSELYSYMDEYFKNIYR